MIRTNGFKWILIGLILSYQIAQSHLSAMPSQGNLRIPEPLLFDEVRPLGAKKGELEVNILGTDLKRDLPFFGELAPEIEYAIADGYAIEGELPIEQEKVAAYKMAFQGTFHSSPFRQSVHGWQFIALYNRIYHRTALTGLYLLAARIHGNYSTLVMIGGEAGGINGSAIIINPTLFYNLNDNISLAIENNIYIGKLQQSYLLLPQIDYNLSSFCTIQLGAGASWQHGHKPDSLFAFRIIFNH